MVPSDFVLIQICGQKSANEQTALQNRGGVRLKRLKTGVCVPEPRVLPRLSRGMGVARSRYLG